MIKNKKYMLNPKLKLNENLFSEDVEKKPTRNGFGEGLVKAGEKNSKVVALCCDLTESVRMHLFAEKFSDRFVEVGVAEQNLASVASGMAAMGKIPFAASYAMFNPGRNWEQIRTTVAYNDVPVKIVGGHAGISVAQDGGTHQAIEDIALMRVVPRMNVIVPVDFHQAVLATQAIAETSAPTYIRLEKQKTAVITTEKTPFEIGKAQVLWGPETMSARVGIISCGSVTATALEVAKYFEEKGIGIKVLNMHTIKPIDSEAIITLAKETERIVTVEEHQKAGGLGSAVAEVLAENHPTIMKMCGVDDVFGESGTATELIAKHGLDFDGIKQAVEDIMK